MRQSQRPLRVNGLFPCIVFLASMLLASVPLGAAQAAARSSKALADPPPAIIFGPGKLQVTLDANWVQAKLAHRVVRQGQNVVVVAMSPLSYPSSYLLNNCNTSPYCANTAYEPPPSGRDAQGTSYTDGYYSNFCAAGATAVTEYFWSSSWVAYWSAGNFTEPSTATRRTTTYWNDSDLRAYIMYVAEQTLVPGWTVPGEVTFGTYPYAYTATADLQNTLNWESSRHNTSNWQNYFYVTVAASDLSASQLNADIMADVAGSVVPLVAITNTSYLPSWSRGGVIHAISIIGYNNTNSTYTYVETCGSDGCGSNGQGVYTISQSQLYNAIENASGNGGIVW